MVISVNGSPVTIDLDSILVWMLVGLVAGFLASHLALGHGLGLIWDIIVGFVGGLFGGIVLTGLFHLNIAHACRPLPRAQLVAVIRARVLCVLCYLLTGRPGLSR